MFSEVLKKRYEVLLRQRSQQIAELKKLVLKQEEELAVKEVEILNLKDQVKKMSQPKKTQTKRPRQRKAKVIDSSEESIDESKSTPN